MVGVLTAGCQGRVADELESTARSYLEAVRVVDHGQMASLVAAADLDRFATIFRRLLVRDSTGELLGPFEGASAGRVASRSSAELRGRYVASHHLR